MDPISALSIASAVVQFIDIGVKVVKKLAEYSEASASGQIPKPLVSINTRLPLLINALGRIQNESDVVGYDFEIRSILHGVVLGCLKLVRELDDIAARIRPQKGENLASKIKKVFSSVKNEDRIEDIDRGLQAYIQVLILHRVVDRTDVQFTVLEDSQYFLVKEKKVANLVHREALLDRLDKCLYGAARAQQSNPEIVVLQGEEGVGKTQLALTYCHLVYELGQFKTIFWLDAATPTTLELGLESIASTIRRTKAGTSREKFTFLSNFFIERWHPWLLVLDNYQHKEYGNHSLTQYLPEKGHGAILLTTRDWDTPPLGTVIKVHQFLTEAEQDDIRLKVTQALHRRDLEVIKDALEHGLGVDSFSRSVWANKGQSFINLAASIGYDDALQLFQSLDANPKLNKMASSVLACAVTSGLVSTVLLCLDHEERTNQYLEHNDYAWAFHRALTEGHVKILELLLIKRREHFKESDHQIDGGIANAAQEGHIKVFQLLLALDHFPQSERVRAHALCKAAESQKVDLVKFLVREARVNLDIPGPDGQPPLYSSTTKNPRDQEGPMSEIVSILLAAGASPNIGRVHDNRTVLHHMASYENIAIMKLLLEHGADVKIEMNSSSKETALMLAVEDRAPASFPLLTDVEISDPKLRKRYFERPMFMAARRGNRDLLLLLLKRDIINSVEESSGDTPLLLAIKEGHTPLARMLIKNKAQTSPTDKQGKAALILAAERGMDLVIKDLSKAADSPGLEVCDDKGNTPLMLAARENHEKAVTMLLGLGADKEAMNRYGETVLDIAEERQLEDIIKLL